MRGDLDSGPILIFCIRGMLVLCSSLIFRRCLTLTLIGHTRSTCCAGNASLQFIATPSLENETRLSSLDSPLRLQSNLQDILTNASLALAENGLDLVTGEQQHSFDILFKSYVDKLSFVEGLSAATSGSFPPLIRPQISALPGD